VFGYSFPPLVQVLQKQVEELDHVLFGIVTHEPALNVAETLVDILGRVKVIFSDNGSTAVEIAIKLACQLSSLRGETNRTHIASFSGGYHGDIIGACFSKARVFLLSHIRRL
jgi:adenosylmethionine---8-amino-7-oxononanoate aminotransferase